jgi:osmoprotectant transport system ATP-binding protein
VLRVGGSLAQFSSPDDLLAHPADDFVASFVGRDRGYRALSFQHAEVPIHEETPAVLGETIGDGDEWRLVVDDTGRPLGWVEVRDVSGPVRTADLQLGGTLVDVHGSLRGFLDASLSSPSGRGVVVQDGRLFGSVRSDEVLQVIKAAPRPSGDTISTAQDRM